MSYSNDIAKASLQIGGIKLEPKNPFTWASGFRMPIYNDNRALLGSAEHRRLVTDGLAEKIRGSYDFIAGTATAGIAPAASLAQALQVPLLIMQEGKAYVFEDTAVESGDVFDAIASTCPWAIPFGVQRANELQVPFMYVRQSAKGHGLKQQIEGLPQEGQQVLLLDYHRGDSYAEKARDALEKREVLVAQTLSRDISEMVQPANIVGAKVVVIEDLISTGGSSATAVQEVRDAHALVEECIAIFTYGLDAATEAFAALDPAVRTDAVLTYAELLEVAVADGVIDDQGQEVLQEWRQDPFNWGEKHGFPRVKKE